MSLDMNKVQTEFDQRLNELNTDKVESFKYKVMEDLNSKYYAIKMECEKREQLLLNSMNLFDEKVDHLKGRISGINAQLKTQDDRFDEVFARIRREIKQGDLDMRDMIQSVRGEARQLSNDFKETTNFIDFTNLRIDSFANVLQQHTSDHVAHAEALTSLLDSKASFESRLRLMEQDEVFQL